MSLKQDCQFTYVFIQLEANGIIRIDESYMFFFFKIKVRRQLAETFANLLNISYYLSFFSIYPYL